MLKMNSSDEEFFTALKTVFTLLPSLFSSDVSMLITDKEKVVLSKQAESYKVNITEGTLVEKDALTQKALKSGKREATHFPKEVFGIPIKGYCIPVINPYTDTMVGTINFCVSMEKENEIVEMVTELQSFSEELAASSEELASSTEELTTNSENANNLVKETKVSLKSMDDIIQYIKGIADTTNLLGLNAAIEASRAGEQGRGFAVVAGEIRKLATNSKNSTRQISETLEKVKENINGIIAACNEFSTTGEIHSSQAEQIAAGSQRLTELSAKLLKFSENII